MLLPVLAFGQGDLAFTRENFPDKLTLDPALSAIKEADRHAANGGRNYALALPLYMQAHQLNPDNASLNTKIGLCHLNGRERHAALPYFERARVLNPADRRIHFLAGLAYQINARWDDAIAAFEEHQRVTGGEPDPNPVYNQAAKHIEECRHGRELMAAPVGATVRNMGPRINSPDPDYGALITADGSSLWFTSKRPGSAGVKVNKSTNEHYEEVLFTTMVNGKWSDPVLLPQPVNTPLNDASVGLFADGRTMIVFRDQKGNGDLYETRRVGAIWGEPKPFGPTINTKANETSAWYSFDRQWLYFVSDREGGQGGKDIWRSPWDPVAGDWGLAENLGPQVNTPYDEEGVFVHPDGRTIYFGSNGHNTMGGYDLFQATWEKGKWSKARNLGWPINSPDDDLFLVLHADGTRGWFSSIRPDGLGDDDLYEVEFPSEATPAATVLLKGVVKGAADAPLAADLEVTRLSTGEQAARFTSDPVDGGYLAAWPARGDHALHVYAKGHLFQCLSITQAEGPAERVRDLLLKPLAAGASEPLPALLFEEGSTRPSGAALATLMQLERLLKEHPGMRITIAMPATMQHAAERGRQVADHLQRRGIEVDRVEVTTDAAGTDPEVRVSQAP